MKQGVAMLCGLVCVWPVVFYFAATWVRKIDFSNIEWSNLLNIFTRNKDE